MLNSTTLAATTVTTTETTVAAITTNEFIFCTAASLVLGLIIAFAFNFRQKKTKSFMMTLALLPVIVQVVIMLVNGNIGTGVAVMGAFSLVRFRSVPGSAMDICAIFLSMAVGVWTGKEHLVSCDGHEPLGACSYACCVREPAEHYLHASAYWQKEVGSQGA